MRVEGWLLVQAFKPVESTKMKKAIVVLSLVGLLGFVWYDGVKHRYHMVIEDSCAKPPTSWVAAPLQRL